MKIFIYPLIIGMLLGVINSKNKEIIKSGKETIALKKELNHFNIQKGTIGWTRIDYIPKTNKEWLETEAITLNPYSKARFKERVKNGDEVFGNTCLVFDPKTGKGTIMFFGKSGWFPLRVMTKGNLPGEVFWFPINYSETSPLNLEKSRDL